MQSFSRIAVTKVAIAALSFAALSPVQAQGRPAAADIIAKYVAAIGGKSEIMKITSLKQIATMDMPAAGLSAQMEMYTAAPNKSAMKASLPGIGDLVSGFNGTIGWEVNPMVGARLKADADLANAADDADFYATLLYSADRFSSMETVGDTTINGEKAYDVKMVRKATNKESHSYFSATSGLVLANRSTQESQMGSMVVTATMSDYKKFGPLTMATKMETSAGPQKMIVTVKDVVINGAPESAFAIPENIKPLIKP